MEKEEEEVVREKKQQRMEEKENILFHNFVGRHKFYYSLGHSLRNKPQIKITVLFVYNFLLWNFLGEKGQQSSGWNSQQFY